MVQFTLFLVRLFKRFILWLGVDYDQYEVLLRTKLTMDFRSEASGFQSAGSKKRTFLSQLYLYSIFGLLFGIASLAVGDIMLSLTIFFSIVMVSLTMALLSEFTSVLFDQRDNSILLSRPISHRTLLFLRLTHIQFYIGYIAVALSFATGFIVAIKYTVLAALVYILAVGLNAWMTLLFTTFIYLLLSRIVEKERFKDIISYAQIFLVVLVFGSYQFLPRLIDSTVLKNVTLTGQWWTYLWPPAWFGALVKLGTYTDNVTPVIFLSLLGLIVPVSGAVLLIRFMSKGFDTILGEDNSGSSIPESIKAARKSNSGTISQALCISDTERAGWALAEAITKRDRKFKQTVYPYFGMMIVFTFIILLPEFTSLSVSVQGKIEFSKYLFISIVGYSACIAIFQLPYTDTPDASWIYAALPLNKPGHLLTGAIKVMLWKLLIPFYLIITIISLWIWGLDLIPQIVLSGLSIIQFILITIIFQKVKLPFTQGREMQEKGSLTLKGLFGMIFMFLQVGVLYLTSLIPWWVTFLLCGLLAEFIILSFKRVRVEIQSKGDYWKG